VALVDPGLPLDMMSALSCPNCRGRLTGRGFSGLTRRRPDTGQETRQPAQPAPRRPAMPAPAPANGPAPSHAAVGLTLAALFMLVLIGAFVWLVLVPHQHYWWALTK
jgi:hypothetical protein